MYNKIFNGEIIDSYEQYDFLKDFFIEDIVYEIRKYIIPVLDKSIYEKFKNDLTREEFLQNNLLHKDDFNSTLGHMNLENRIGEISIIGKDRQDSICDLFFKISSKNENETIQSLKQQINSIIFKVGCAEIYHITKFSIFKIKNGENIFFYVGSPLFHLPISCVSAQLGPYYNICIDRDGTLLNVEELQFTRIFYEPKLRFKLASRGGIHGFDKKLVSVGGFTYLLRIGPNWRPRLKCKEEIIHNIFEMEILD